MKILKTIWDLKMIWVTILFVVIVTVHTFNVVGDCDGKKEWFNRTGILRYIFVEDEICCHCYGIIKFYNQSVIRTVDCDKSLMDIPLNQSYTFYFEPYAEPYATTGNEAPCFWDVVVDYVKDENGVVVYGSDGWI